jgi:hypothetical protein|tara:strand:+ start:2268 stop:3557 length:1290 start_codon:yes stop_codon:yes gene_type:complete
MELSTEIFNILKGANIKLKMFDFQGNKTLDAENSARLYAYVEDFLVTIRLENDEVEVLVQAGADFSFDKHKDLLSSIKKAGHNAMAEYTIRKFDKNIVPKDFAHDTVSEGYARATGSMKTSYIQLPESTRLVIKHNKSVNEEVRGSRSRNIQAMFIENSAGERFRFPHKYLSGAKSMAKHVSMGGTPYDAIGESILNICNEVAQCNQFLRHVRSNKLVNEGNQDIVETIKSKLTELKNTVNSLQTVKGYDSYSAESVAIVENSENDTKEVDISDKFMYNTFKNTDMDAVLETVARIVKERDSMTDLTKQYFDRLMDMIKGKEDFKITCDPNDPEHPDNEDPVKYSGPSGAMAKLSSMLSYLAMCSKNDEAFNILSHLGSELYNLPQKHVVLMAKICKYLDSNYDANPKQVEPAESITESVLNDLRRKVA